MQAREHERTHLSSLAKLARHTVSIDTEIRHTRHPARYAREENRISSVEGASLFSRAVGARVSLDTHEMRERFSACFLALAERFFSLASLFS